MKKRSQAINTVWTVILTILSLAWVYPVVVVLINSFKKDSAISTNTAFQLPPADGFAGLGNYANAIHSKGFLAAFFNLCGADPGLLLHVRVVHHPRKDVGHEALLLPVRVLHGGALPDAHVHPGKSGG